MENLPSSAFNMSRWTETAPDDLFDRMCALELMNVALRQLESEYRRRGKGAIFDALGPFLSHRPSEEQYRVVCGALSIPAPTARSHLHRMRKRYFKLFREEVMQTLEDSQCVDDEIRNLLDALGRTGVMSLSH